jgi:hypothetical protein
MYSFRFNNSKALIIKLANVCNMWRYIINTVKENYVKRCGVIKIRGERSIVTQWVMVRTSYLELTTLHCTVMQQKLPKISVYCQYDF